jgi:hypothetical protein
VQPVPPFGTAGSAFFERRAIANPAVPKAPIAGRAISRGVPCFELTIQPSQRAGRVGLLPVPRPLLLSRGGADDLGEHGARVRGDRALDPRAASCSGSPRRRTPRALQGGSHDGVHRTTTRRQGRTSCHSRGMCTPPLRSGANAPGERFASARGGANPEPDQSHPRRLVCSRQRRRRRRPQRRVIAPAHDANRSKPIDPRLHRAPPDVVNGRIYGVLLVARSSHDDH